MHRERERGELTSVKASVKEPQNRQRVSEIDKGGPKVCAIESALSSAKLHELVYILSNERLGSVTS